MSSLAQFSISLHKKGGGGKGREDRVRQYIVSSLLRSIMSNNVDMCLGEKKKRERKAILQRQIPSPENTQCFRQKGKEKKGLPVAVFEIESLGGSLKGTLGGGEKLPPYLLLPASSTSKEKKEGKKKKGRGGREKTPFAKFSLSYRSLNFGKL